MVSSEESELDELEDEESESELRGIDILIYYILIVIIKFSLS